MKTRRIKPTRWAALASVALVVTVGSAACSSGAAQESSQNGSGQVQVQGATLIDVRTPQEFASGHLEGAENIDISSPTFDSSLGALPKTGTYVVYCRSGNRSAAAVKQMKSLGFTTVTDVGGLQDASSATGVSIVKG